jgi:phage/plasmid-like protein (TIGR03299 family)
MSHEIDQMADGVHAAVFARKDAWHKLGTTLDHEFTAAEAMEFAHLGGWDVRKINLTAHENDNTIAVPDRWATVRTNPVTGATEYLGVVGSHYTPIQNEEHVDLLDALVDESGAHFDTAGSLKGGREVFVTMKMPETLKIAGADELNLNLVALNSHDGQSPFRFLVSPVRVVCANTQAAAIRNCKSSFSARHVGKSGGKIQEAREALGLTWKYIDAFQAEAEAMVATKITPRQFDMFAAELLGIKPGSEDKVGKRTLDHAENLKSLWRGSETLKGIRNTRWGAYQTVTEYFDHFAPANGQDKETGRAVRTLTSAPIINLKTKAFELARG